MNKNVKKILLYGTAGAILSSTGAISTDINNAHASSFFEDAFQDEKSDDYLGNYQLIETGNVYYKDSDVLEGYQYVTQADLEAIKSRVEATCRGNESELVILDEIDDDSQIIYLDNAEDYNEDFYCFTSTDFYKTLVDAEEKYGALLDKGKVSEQIVNNGTKLDSNEKKYIDNSEIYQF